MFVLAKDVPFEERMLWASVLRRAVFDYVLYKSSGRRSLEWKRAYQYVFCRGMEYDNGFNFEEVCALFDWDPDYLRRLTSKLTREDVKKMESSSFRGDFTFDVVSTLVEKVECWKNYFFAVPFLPLFCFNEETRREVEPKVVWKRTYDSDNWRVAV